MSKYLMNMFGKPMPRMAVRDAVVMIGVISALVIGGRSAASFAATDDVISAAEEEMVELFDADEEISLTDAPPPDEFVRAVIVAEEGAAEAGSGVVFTVRMLEGDEKGTERAIVVSDIEISGMTQRAEPGDKVVLVKSTQLDGEVAYYLADNYRLPALAWMLVAFFALAVVFGGWRGLTAMLGLAASAAVIIWFVVPRIIAGTPPFAVTLIAAFAIAAVSLFLAHGFNLRTTIAFVGTVVTLVLSAALALLSVRVTALNGLGDESAAYLQIGILGELDLRGLLLAGITLGVLGVLDDITTAQSAVVEELKRANPSLGSFELYRRGLSVGREHIASLVNTLFLAYAGVSLPLFLLFNVYKNLPAWFVLNGETIAEEVVRTVVGSVCLIIAVPLTTAIAAAYWGTHVPREAGPEAPHHH